MPLPASFPTVDMEGAFDLSTTKTHATKQIDRQLPGLGQDFARSKHEQNRQ